ncbi:hypothetical protein WJX72_002947 [[Myrmecia] bisecta]|uniref:Lon N-terminal domain-containing protein n=1 Tax=[Myrmecia] bisecta TaxID=41462 RepID=A0AAW1PJW6_9CHLO
MIKPAGTTSSTHRRCRQSRTHSTSEDTSDFSRAQSHRNQPASGDANPGSLHGESATVSWGNPEMWQSQLTDQAATPPQWVLPIMPIESVRLPMETVALQLFEPRYRLMFKLIKRSPLRQFGLVLADKANAMMEGVGTVCQMTHFAPIPERGRIFVSSRATGRFRVVRLLQDKPFVLALVEPYNDEAPADVAAAARLAALERRLWQCMQDVRALAGKLYSHAGPLGDEVFTTEVRRWCPDRSVLRSDELPASGEPEAMQVLGKAGILGSSQGFKDRVSEYLCLQTVQPTTEMERQERFSFALARTLDVAPAVMQSMLDMRSTAERLQQAEAALVDGRAYLAARSTLRDLF